MTRLLSCISLVLVVAINHAANAHTIAEEERLLKAAYIFNFAKFTEWPQDVWQSHDDSLNICTAGSDELIAELKRLSGKTVMNHPIVVLRLEDSKKQGKCHLLYIAGSEEKSYKKILASISATPVLTVSELAGFAHLGGVIELYRENNKTRFIINLTAAREAGLVISSRLLILATVIGNEVTP